MIDRDEVGFHLIEAHEIDDIGVFGIVDKVKQTVGDTPTYLSIDIDGTWDIARWSPSVFSGKPQLMTSSP